MTAATTAVMGPGIFFDILRSPTIITSTIKEIAATL